MKTPTIHHNGTSRDALLKGYIDAAEAIRDALKLVAQTAPNGRDYYPQGNTAILDAQREHKARLKMLMEVYRELSEMIDAVDGYDEEIGNHLFLT